MKMTESELLEKVAQMFNTNLAGSLIPYLDDEIHYTSETAKVDITGKNEVVKFLMEKNKSIRFYRYKSWILRYAIIYLSQSNEKKSYLLFCERVKRTGSFSKVMIKVKNSKITDIEIRKIEEPTEPDETVL